MLVRFPWRESARYLQRGARLSSLVSWLDEQPVVLVLLGLVAVSLGLAIALTHLAERVFEPEARSRTSTSMTTAVGVVAGLYAVLAAFVIVNEWQAFNDAQATISSESAGLADALATRASCPTRPLADTARPLRLRPIGRVRRDPVPRDARGALAANQASTTGPLHDRGSERFARPLRVLQPRGRRTFRHHDGSKSPDQLCLCRRFRTCCSQQSWSRAWRSSATVSALDTQHRRWHIAITTALTVIVALNFLLIVTLDRPFDGAATVDDALCAKGSRRHCFTATRARRHHDARLSGVHNCRDKR